MLVNEFLSRSIERYPNKEALICSEGRYSYRDIGKRVRYFSDGLMGMNLKKADRVLIFLENSIESVISIFGILEAGGVFVIINPQIKSKKIEYMINDCKAKILITDSKHLDQFRDILEKCSSLESIIITDIEKEETILLKNRCIKLIPFFHLREKIYDINYNFKIIDVDLASIIYTSGSTGFPKGVVLTHRNMVSATDSIIEYLENTSHDKIFNVLPLSFDYGLYQLLMTFKFGGRLVLEKSFIFPHHILNLLSQEKVTGFPIVPTIANILLSLKNLRTYDFSILRYITNTAQKLHKKTVLSLIDTFPHVKIFSMYGLTECKRVTYLPPDKLEIKPESVGQAMPNTEAFIVDSDGNRINKAKVVGELVVRGANVMLGYWNNPEDTKNMIQPGDYDGDRWLFTGDLFEMDSDGDLYFVSRIDDMIKTAGEKVSPKEIENILYEIEDVIEAAVVGIPDKLLGQAIKAFVVLKNDSKLDQKSIIIYCSKYLEKFMIPKYVEIRDELPKTSSGKINIRDLMNIK